MRFHLVRNVKVPFTPAEEIERDAEEALQVPILAKQAIDDVFQIDLEAAKNAGPSLLTDIEIDTYGEMWEEMRLRQRDTGATVELIQAFATGRGITPAAAATLVRNRLRPYKLAKAQALAKRDKAIANL